MCVQYVMLYRIIKNELGGRTMSKSANINIRIEPEVKASAEALYSKFGITVTDAINMFLHQSIMVGGLPFDLKQPRYNQETEEAMEETRAIQNGTISAKTYHAFSEVLDELDE